VHPVNRADLKAIDQTAQIQTPTFNAIRHLLMRSAICENAGVEKKTTTETICNTMAEVV
jgi:hypothetical protein